MDEQRKTLGRSRIYTGNSDDGEPGVIPEEARRERRAQHDGTVPKKHLSAPPGRRRRDEETDAKMRLLWSVLLVLIVILGAAIFYEIVLGHGSLESGADRMATYVQETETEPLSLTEEDDSERALQTEEDSDAETEVVLTETAGEVS